MKLFRLVATILLFLLPAMSLLVYMFVLSISSCIFHKICKVNTSIRRDSFANKYYCQVRTPIYILSFSF